MFERFTDRSRRAVMLAQEMAKEMGCQEVGTEFLLLGLLQEHEGVGGQALEQSGISLEAVRAQVEEIIGRGDSSPSGHIPFTARARTVLELSLREALQLGHNYIGTEHILLGLIRDGKGVAAEVLVKLGADLSRVRQQVIQLLSSYTSDRDSAPVHIDRPASGEPVADYVDRLIERARELGSRHETDLFRALELSQELNGVLIKQLDAVRKRVIALESCVQPEPESATG